MIKPETYGDAGKQNIFNRQTKQYIDLLLSDGTFNSKVPFSPAPDGINQSFTLDYEIEPNTEQIWIGGMFLFDSGDYSILGTSLTFDFVPLIADKITIFGKRKV